MTFDEQVRQTFDSLTAQLRDEVSRQLQAAAENVARAAREAQASAPRQEPQLAAPPRHEDEDPSEIADRIADRQAAAAVARVADAIRTIDQARTLTDVLDALATCAARDAARVAVVLVRPGHVRPWRLTGFGTEPPRTLAVSYDETGVIAEAINARIPVTGPKPPVFAQLRAGEEAFAAPLTMGGEVVAVLYADQGAAETDVRRPGKPLETSRPETFAEFPSERRETIPSPVVHALPTHALEVMARHAGRCLETITAFKTARALAGRNGTAAAKNGSKAANGPSRDELNGDDDVAARRYARLLVSEIKLYHEPEVAAGRRERDLVTRLGGEITRARRLYEERVPAEVRRRADYFHDELVRTLAEGDATLLQLT
jgi:hypothetical protein